MADPNIASGMRQGRRRTTFQKPSDEKIKPVSPVQGKTLVGGQSTRGVTSSPVRRTAVGAPDGRSDLRVPREKLLGPPTNFNDKTAAPPNLGAKEHGKANRFPLQAPATDGLKKVALGASSRAGSARGAMPRPPGLAKRAAGAQSARDFAPGRALKKAIPKPARRKARRKAQ